MKHQNTQKDDKIPLSDDSLSSSSYRGPQVEHQSQCELPFSSACQGVRVPCREECAHGTFPEWVSGPLIPMHGSEGSCDFFCRGKTEILGSCSRFEVTLRF